MSKTTSSTEMLRGPAVVPFTPAALGAGEKRPRWSVMIPTFNCAVYLRETLQSVLRQDLGLAAMQIEVIDDCSTKDDPEAVVRELGGGRITFYRQPKNGGAINNFNTCIARARGELVHILHGDDYVLPGFYTRVGAEADQHPEVAAFFMRSLIIDEDGTLDRVSMRLPGLARPARVADELLYANHLFTPGAVVRRSFYEQAGGFRLELVHVADWDMWMRAICQGGGLWINELLAAYRFFPGNDSGRLARTAENLRDYLRIADIFETSFPAFDRARFERMVVQRAEAQIALFTGKGDREAVAANRELWRKLLPWPQRVLRKIRQQVRGIGA